MSCPQPWDHLHCEMFWKETRILRRWNGPFYNTLLHGAICYFCSCKYCFHKIKNTGKNPVQWLAVFLQWVMLRTFSGNLGHSPCTTRVLFSILSWIFSKGSLVLLPFSLILKAGCSQDAISILLFCSSLHILTALGLFISPSWPAQFFINPFPTPFA